MNFKTIVISSLFLLLPAGLAASGCSTDAPTDKTSASDEQVERGKIGKADLYGSCIVTVADVETTTSEKNYCGGKSYGNCWCDDACTDFGDCCTDVEESCDLEEPSACETDELYCGSCCGEDLCVADTEAGCPSIQCPAFCPAPACNIGEIECGGCCGENFCVEDTAAGCPEVQCKAFCPGLN